MIVNPGNERLRGVALGYVDAKYITLNNPLCIYQLGYKIDSFFAPYLKVYGKQITISRADKNINFTDLAGNNNIISPDLLYIDTNICLSFEEVAAAEESAPATFMVPQVDTEIYVQPHWMQAPCKLPSTPFDGTMYNVEVVTTRNDFEYISISSYFDNGSNMQRSDVGYIPLKSPYGTPYKLYIKHTICLKGIESLDVTFVGSLVDNKRLRDRVDDTHIHLVEEIQETPDPVTSLYTYVWSQDTLILVQGIDPETKTMYGYDFENHSFVIDDMVEATVSKSNRYFVPEVNRIYKVPEGYTVVVTTRGEYFDELQRYYSYDFDFFDITNISIGLVKTEDLPGNSVSVMDECYFGDIYQEPSKVEVEVNLNTGEGTRTVTSYDPVNFLTVSGQYCSRYLDD